MTFNLKKNRKYILAAVLCFFVLPHIPQLYYPEFYQAVLANGYTPMGLSQRFEDYWWMFLLHNYCIYLIPPLFAGILGLVHVRHERVFCPVLSVLGFLSVLTFLLWNTNTWAAATMLVSAVSMTLIDGLGTLSLFAMDKLQPDRKRSPRLLMGATQNLRFLALLAFWLVAVPVCFQIYFTGTVLGNYDNWFWYPFMFYAPISALVLPLCCHDEDCPMSPGGMIIATVLFLLSAGISSCVNYCRFSKVNLIFVGGSYLIFALTEGVMALWRRHKARKTSADGSAA